jgi:two-component system osmolarity sensor histidine kinase EnvZ
VDRFTRSVAAELRSRLEPGTVLARTVNGQPGLWVGFNIDKDRSGCRPTPPAWSADPGHLVRVGGHRPCGHPCRLDRHRAAHQPAAAPAVSFAASRIREGEFDSCSTRTR